MKPLLFATFAIINVWLCPAQDYSLEYGKITDFELLMKNYPYDKEAPAAVLYDIGNSNFVQSIEGGFDVAMERSTKIKILNEAGFKYAEIEIPYYHEGTKTEKVEIIEARTYNLTDKGTIMVKSLDLKNTYKEKYNDNWDVIKFTMPDIQPGSVIEYKYKLTNPYVSRLYDWEFQTDIPVKYSKYSAAMIPFYTFTFILQGASKFDYQPTYERPGLENNIAGVKYKELIYEWVMENVPAFHYEGFITSKDDYLIKLDFQLTAYYDLGGVKSDLISTWPALSNDLENDPSFGSYISASKRNTKSIAEQITASCSADYEILESACNYVKQNYSWNGMSLFWTQQSVKEFTNSKKGNSAEINLYLLGLLQNTNMEVLPVILSTRDHGKIKVDFPFTHFFNYVAILVKIDNKMILVDATEPLLDFKLIPPRCLNEKGLVIMKKEPYWISLQNNTPSAIQQNFILSPLPESDSISAEVTLIATNYDAFNLRKEINDKPKNLEDYIEKKYPLTSKLPETRNFSDLKKPFVIGFQTQLPLEYIGNKIYVSPFLSEPISENPFKSSTRKYPVDMTYAQSREYVSYISIPDGYKVSYVPVNDSTDNKLYSFNYKAIPSDNNLKVTATYTFKQAVYSEKDYAAIRFQTNQLINKLNDKIVLVAEDNK